MDEDIFLARREISQQTSINGVGGIAGMSTTCKFKVFDLVRFQWSVSVSGVG